MEYGIVHRFQYPFIYYEYHTIDLSPKFIDRILFSNINREKEDNALMDSKMGKLSCKSKNKIIYLIARGIKNFHSL